MPLHSSRSDTFFFFFFFFFLLLVRLFVLCGLVVALLTFLVSEVEDAKNDIVTVVVWDKDPIGKDFLGMASVPVSLADHRKDPLDVWVPLKPRLELSDSKKTLRTHKPVVNGQGGRGEVRIVMTLAEAPKVKENKKKRTKRTLNLYGRDVRR
jgi:hypothetical protein